MAGGGEFHHFVNYLKKKSRRMTPLLFIDPSNNSFC